MMEQLFKERKEKLHLFKSLRKKRENERKEVPEGLYTKCPKCKEGDIVEKRTKKHKIFYACNRYPKCDFALWDKPTGKLCPKCKSPLVETKRKQIKCSNKECDYIEK